MGRQQLGEGGKGNSLKIKSIREWKPNTHTIIFTQKAFERPAFNIV